MLYKIAVSFFGAAILVIKQVDFIRFKQLALLFFLNLRLIHPNL
jgi:hypothetical protein